MHSYSSWGLFRLRLGSSLPEQPLPLTQHLAEKALL